jgi:uncharacterized protein YpmS
MTDPVWSVNFMVFLSLVLAALMVAYIFYIVRQEELEEDGQVRKQGQEGSIEAESRQRDCEES